MMTIICLNLVKIEIFLMVKLRIDMTIRKTTTIIKDLKIQSFKIDKFNIVNQFNYFLMIEMRRNKENVCMIMKTVRISKKLCIKDSIMMRDIKMITRDLQMTIKNIMNQLQLQEIMSISQYMYHQKMNIKLTMTMNQFQTLEITTRETTILLNLNTMLNNMSLSNVMNQIDYQLIIKNMNLFIRIIERNMMLSLKSISSLFKQLKTKVIQLHLKIETI